MPNTIPMKTFTGALLTTLLATTECEGLKLQLAKTKPSVQELRAQYERAAKLNTWQKQDPKTLTYKSLKAADKNMRGAQARRTSEDRARKDFVFFSENPTKLIDADKKFHVHDPQTEKDKGRIVTSVKKDGKIYQFSEEFGANALDKENWGTARVFSSQTGDDQHALPQTDDEQHVNPRVVNGVTKHYDNMEERLFSKTKGGEVDGHVTLGQEQRKVNVKSMGKKLDTVINMWEQKAAGAAWQPAVVKSGETITGASGKGDASSVLDF